MENYLNSEKTLLRDKDLLTCPLQKKTKIEVFALLHSRRGERKRDLVKTKVIMEKNMKKKKKEEKKLKCQKYRTRELEGN